jgi:AAA15 family ATPase/GTPase
MDLGQISETPAKSMLSSFFVRNFRSILELRLDFSYGEGKAPNGHRTQEILPFIEAPNEQRLVPCAAFFGANASGKTNLLKAFGVLLQLLREGGKLADLFDPNLLIPKFSDTTLAPEFILGADRFEYRITYSATAIREEELLKNGKPIYTIQNLAPEFSSVILSSAYSREKLSDILRVECSDGEGRQTKPFLHRIGLGYPGLNSDLKSVFAYFQTSLKFVANEGQVLLPFAVEVLAAILGGDKATALREITDVVRRLDIDISAIDITQREVAANEPLRPGNVMRIDQQTGARHSIQITATHRDATGTPALLDFIKHESAGTQRLAGLVGLILHTLKTGGVFLVDELDCSLHPLLMREIVLLFKKRRHNPNGAQLIFTTHNTDILDDSILRLSEITLVRKTAANGTLVRRLVDAKKAGEDVRNVTNFRKQYLAGFYSGIPHPAL